MPSSKLLCQPPGRAATTEELSIVEAEIFIAAPSMSAAAAAAVWIGGLAAQLTNCEPATRRKKLMGVGGGAVVSLSYKYRTYKMTPREESDKFGQNSYEQNSFLHLQFGLQCKLYIR